MFATSPTLYGTGIDQYRASGSVYAITTDEVMKTSLDAGSGQSGSPIFYDSVNATTYSGQGHYIIGVLARSVNNAPGQTDWNGGPTVKQFRSFVQGFLN